MRIFWRGRGKPVRLPQGVVHVKGTERTYQTHDSHQARNMGAADPRWSITEPTDDSVVEVAPEKADAPEIVPLSGTSAGRGGGRAGAPPPKDSEDDEDEPDGE